MISYQTVTPATTYPVTTVEAVAHVNAQGVGDDDYLASLNIAATAWAEEYTGRAFINRTYKAFLDAWPVDTRGYQLTTLDLPKPPLVSVTHVKTYDDADAVTTFSSASYFVDTNSLKGRLALRTTAAWPSVTRTANGIEIQWVAGYGAAADVPQPIKQAILLLVGHWYANREAVKVGETVANIPMGVEALLNAYRVWAL